jgi:hypothetical protein
VLLNSIASNAFGKDLSLLAIKKKSVISKSLTAIQVGLLKKAQVLFWLLCSRIRGCFLKASFAILFALVSLSFLPLKTSAASAQIRCVDFFVKSFDPSNSAFLAEATFGPEFTFTNEKILSEADDSGFPESEKVFLKVRKLLEKKCELRTNCTIAMGSDKHGGNFRITYADGWYFEVGIDKGVLEVQSKKGTYQDFQNNKGRLQQDIFNLMKFAGLTPHAFAGGGHIHIGADLFQNDPVLFRNFFTDYANFPQLGRGIFADPNPNHPPIAILKDYQQGGFVKALADFDKLENPTLKNFSWLIHSLVYTEDFMPDWGGASYYQAIRLERMFWLDGKATVEIRGFRPQRSAAEFLLELEVIAARMDYLKANAGRIAYRYENSPPDFSAFGIIMAYKTYLTEAGLSWTKYKVLLPPHLQALSLQIN